MRSDPPVGPVREAHRSDLAEGTLANLPTLCPTAHHTAPPADTGESASPATDSETQEGLVLPYNKWLVIKDLEQGYGKVEMEDHLR